METNSAIVAVTSSVCSAETPNFLTAQIEYGPMILAIGLANVVICVAVVWLALRNIVALSRPGFDSPAARGVECRVAITRYLLLFLGVVWLCMLASVLQWTTLNMVSVEPTQRGVAWQAMMCANVQVPVVTACVLAVLTGLHCVVGILFAVRRSRMAP